MKNFPMKRITYQHLTSFYKYLTLVHTKYTKKPLHINGRRGLENKLLPLSYFLLCRPNMACGC